MLVGRWPVVHPAIGLRFRRIRSWGLILAPTTDFRFDSDCESLPLSHGKVDFFPPAKADPLGIRPARLHPTFASSIHVTPLPIWEAAILPLAPEFCGREYRLVPL